MTGQTAKVDSLAEQERKELELFGALKPYLGQCLSLNHDLNNPLAGIVGFLEFLMEESDQLSDEHREFVEQINLCSERMCQVLERLSDQKIALSAKVDLRSVIEAYQPSDNTSD